MTLIIGAIQSDIEDVNNAVQNVYKKFYYLTVRGMIERSTLLRYFQATISVNWPNVCSDTLKSSPRKFKIKSGRKHQDISFVKKTRNENWSSHHR